MARDGDRFGRGFVGFLADGSEMPANKDDVLAAVYLFKSKRETEPLAAAVALRAAVVQSSLSTP